MPQQLSLFHQTHQNHYLFADYYLNKRIQSRPEWSVTLQDHDKYEQLKELWATFKPEAQGANEAQTEQRWIQPVLNLLEHVFQVQVSLNTPHGIKQPDYVFFPDASARTALPSGPVTEAQLAQALAVADAKRWERKLDQTGDASDPSEGKGLSQNPSYQIDFYIRFSGLGWGILTNGRHWRLYHRESSKKLDVYYEVDLPALLEQNDVDAFNYFYRFFRRQALARGGWLYTVLEESEAYQRGVGDNLKEQVYEALRSLAQGFLAYPGNSFPTYPDHATLGEIYDNSLIILYRILFTLYAESRSLLPLANDLYRGQYSFDALKQRIRHDMDLSTPAGTTISRIWNQLQDLWNIIDQGNDELGVPAYNGGLFSPEQHPFLEQYQVGDRYLRSAIDLLARTKDPHTSQREFVDYRDLSVRHLGSIYEGLLEYQLRVAKQPLRVLRKEKREFYEPLEEGDAASADILVGEAYLITDKGERKATGSYYTPDYIVQYIVEYTLRPMLDATATPFRNDDGTVHDEASLVQKILELNVLDPAMGSGHFLVAATDFIARYLVSLELKEAGSENELDYWRRRVVQACIYGVDLNPLAVELAKLSLWLNTIARDKPLNFLDHHLRCGNSVIGVRAEELLLNAVQKKKKRRRKSKALKQKEAGQLSLIGDEYFTASIGSASGVMGKIEALASDNLQQVRQAETLYNEQARAATRSYRQLADIWASRQFGLEIDDTLWQGMTDHILRKGMKVPHYERILQESRQIAVSHRFFHWELEFPEVFFSDLGALQKEAGFDAVIGNPPYINAIEMTRNLSPKTKPFWKARFESAEGAYDIYVIFFEQALRLLRSGKLLGFITPNKYLSSPYAVALRKYILANHTLGRVYDVSGLPVFGDEASVYPIVTIIEEGVNNNVVEFAVEKAVTETLGETIVQPKENLSKLPDNIWGFILSNGIQTVLKIDEISEQLNSVADVSASTTAAEADEYSILLTEKENINDQAFIPIVNTGLIDRYCSLWGHNKLTHQGKQYKKPFLEIDPKIVSERRQKQYKTQKLIFAKMALNIEVLPDLNGAYASVNTNFAIAPTTRLRYLAALCNSRLLSWVYAEYFGALRMSGGYLQFQAPQIGIIPIRKIDFTTSDEMREQLLDKGKSLFAHSLEKRELSSTLRHTQQQLDESRSDVIHDLLSYLAKKMIGYNNQHLVLKRARDPFKYLNRDISFLKFADLFADAVKYSQLIGDIDSIHHDIVAFCLVPSSPGSYDLRLQLKLRNPDEGWQSWQYEEGGANIRRQWVTAYNFINLDSGKARYYHYALPILGEFNNSRSFPGGYTRTTQTKLNATMLPVYDQAVNLAPLKELDDELTQISDTIRHTDQLIDQIVYKLYDLTEEEINIVEGS